MGETIPLRRSGARGLGRGVTGRPPEDPEGSQVPVRCVLSFKRPQTRDSRKAMKTSRRSMGNLPPHAHRGVGERWQGYLHWDRHADGLAEAGERLEAPRAPRVQD